MPPPPPTPPSPRKEGGAHYGGVMVIVRDDIPSKEIKVNILHFNIECLFREFNIRKAKWLVVGCFHLPSQNDDYYFCNLSKVLDSLNSNYENFLLIAGFSSEQRS